jgi:hypothetical protein
MVTACMGGWCGIRDRCERYNATPDPKRPPVERLCIPGTDGFAYGTPVVIAQPQGPWAMTLGDRAARAFHMQQQAAP